jgi:hypothetical protein
VAETQCFPAVHGFAQPPQFSVSVWTFVQNAIEPEPQALGVAVGQEQTEPTQCWPSAHTVPQAPQLLTSLERLAQYEGDATGHAAYPATQLRRQTPPEHRTPCTQTLPHPPQLVGLVDRSVQTPEQLVSPAWHVRPQVPPEQIFPTGHGVPAVPPVQVPEAPQ